MALEQQIDPRDKQEEWTHLDVKNKTLHWNGIPVQVTGLITVLTSNLSLIKGK